MMFIFVLCGRENSSMENLSNLSKVTEPGFTLMRSVSRISAPVYHAILPHFTMWCGRGTRAVKTWVKLVALPFPGCVAPGTSLNL